MKWLFFISTRSKHTIRWCLTTQFVRSSWGFETREGKTSLISCLEIDIFLSNQPATRTAPRNFSWKIEGSIDWIKSDDFFKNSNQKHPYEGARKKIVRVACIVWYVEIVKLCFLYWLCVSVPYFVIWENCLYRTGFLNRITDFLVTDKHKRHLTL